MRFRKREQQAAAPKYPGVPTAVDGRTAVVQMETAASEATAAWGDEGWTAAAVTAGFSLVGLRAASFASGQGVASMHESLYAAAGKRLPYVLNVACRAMTKQGLSVHAGHDDYHAVDDTGFFQLFAKNVQEVADLTLIAHRIAELSLTPGICAQDGFLTSHAIESIRLPERALVREYLGDPADLIESPTPAQRLVFGERRRRIPEMFDLDYPTMLGGVQRPDSYAQGVAAQRPFYFDHLRELTERAFAEYAALTGRHYARCAGYRLDDAEWVIVGQGSVVSDAEAVCDHLRASRNLRVGVVNVSMFRPFPADLLTERLRGTRGVLVLERVDQPLAVDPPLARELRAALGKAVENGRARSAPAPHPGLAACAPPEVPDVYTGCFGLGSRDLRPADLIAAVDNMREGGARRRHFYLGIDFVRARTRLPKLQIWQETLLESYPELAHLALVPGAAVSLRPAGALSLRVHAAGDRDAVTLGTTLALTAAELLGLRVKAYPETPTTFCATLAAEPIRTNAELRPVDVVLSPDPGLLRHADPLAELAEGGGLVLQSDLEDAELWQGIPAAAQRALKARRIRVFALDAVRVVTEEAPGPGLRAPALGAAFLGAFFRVAPLGTGLDEPGLVQALRGPLGTRFGQHGAQAVEASLRVVRRGYTEVRELDLSTREPRPVEVAAVPQRPATLDAEGARPGLGHPGRFWEQVGYLYSTGQDGIADPFAALGALPAATSTIRDLSDVRVEVPEFLPARCTGCGECWTQCPDSAIPGIVNPIDEVLTAAIATAGDGRAADRLTPIVKHLAAEARRLLGETPSTAFGDVAARAYTNVVARLGYAEDRRAKLDAEWAPVQAALAELPLARTALFFDAPEARAAGSGGLLSVTLDPAACKGCNICVEVCPEGALVTVTQTDAIVERLRRSWRLWQRLPDTDDRYVDLASREEGIGALPALLLKKANYLSLQGGDSAPTGRSEKTALHLVLAALNALMQPRVRAHGARLDQLIAQLDQKARALLASDVDVGHLTGGGGTVAVPLEDAKRAHVERIAGILGGLRDLRWRYTEGPGGHGRAVCGIANATDGAAVWASTYPLNPYPFPWVSHLVHDAPALALGLFEGHMRKMAGGFAVVRRAELELADAYDPATHEPELAHLDWRGFTDDELALCPPILAVGGDAALLGSGLESLSRLLASGKPLRVVMLDTQAAAGAEEPRKELALLALAHRDVFVLQSSPAAASHLLAGVLRGLQSRCPAVLALHCPSPPEPGGGEPSVARAARLALESRAFPLLVHDPAAGPKLAQRLSLDGNPAVDEPWPVYELRYADAAGAERTLALPVTVADWAATEPRFRRHFTRLAADVPEQDLVVFHEYLGLPADERAGKTPFVWTLEAGRRLGRLAVADAIVRLAEDRREVWAELRDLAGLKTPEAVLFERQLAALRAEYEAKLADLRARYPQAIARRLAESLLRGNGAPAVADLLAGAATAPAPPRPPAAAPAPAAAPVAVATAPAVAGPATDAPLALEAYIDTALCTACNECTNLNKRMFAYNAKKQAYIKDPRAGTFKDLVQAAEKCPVKIIHPGAPLNPNEKDLDKWVQRATAFN